MLNKCLPLNYILSHFCSFLKTGPFWAAFGRQRQVTLCETNLVYRKTLFWKKKKKDRVSLHQVALELTGDLPVSV